MVRTTSKHASQTKSSTPSPDKLTPPLASPSKPSPPPVDEQNPDIASVVDILTSPLQSDSKRTSNELQTLPQQSFKTSPPTDLDLPRDPVPPRMPKTQAEIDTYITEKLHVARNALIESSFYLGDANFDLSKFSWTRHGTSDTLTHTPNDTPVAATLSAVVFITAEDFWMTSCGMWRGPSDYSASLAQIKLSCTGGLPTHELFAPDFEKVIHNLTALLALGAKAENSGNNRGVLFKGADLQLKIKFRHVLFEPISKNDTPDSTPPEEIPNAFKIENWPAQHPAAKEALQFMAENNTHTVIPIPAYDMHGRLIEPSDYRKRLEGSLVQIHFSLMHWFFAPKKSTGRLASDAFAANVVSMRVLIPPKAGSPVTPRKRPFHGSDPFTPDLHMKKPKLSE